MKSYGLRRTLAVGAGLLAVGGFLSPGGASAPGFGPFSGGLLAPRALSAQEDQEIQLVKVEGEVLDVVTGLPVAVAIIAIPELGRSAISDEWGYFRMEDVPVGVYPMQVMRIGYETLGAEVPLLQGETLAVHLTPGAVPLEGIEIRVTDENDLDWRQASTMTLSVIGPVEMETLRERYISLGHVLTSRHLPGSRYAPPKNVGGKGCLRLTQESLSLMTVGTNPCAAVVVDGVLLTDEAAGYAFDMGTEAIFAMRFMRGSEAALRYGTVGGNGVLVIETRLRR